MIEDSKELAEMMARANHEAWREYWLKLRPFDTPAPMWAELADDIRASHIAGQVAALRAAQANGAICSQCGSFRPTATTPNINDAIGRANLRINVLESVIRGARQILRDGFKFEDPVSHLDTIERAYEALGAAHGGTPPPADDDSNPVKVMEKFKRRAEERSHDLDRDAVILRQRAELRKLNEALFRRKTSLDRANSKIEKLTEELHYANGCADLALKHRDEAEAIIKRTRGES